MSQTALITGASSGIGLELAKQFAQVGDSLVLVARSETKLQQLKNEFTDKYSIHVDVVVADLAESNAAEKILQELKQRKLVIDILVNNAGFGELGLFHEIETQRQLKMIRLNVEAVVHLTRLLLPEMIKRNGGAILNVGSVAGFQPGPNMAVYYATKAFVLSFSEAIHEELLGSGIKVVCLAPGATKTGFGDDSGMNKTRIFKSNLMTAEVVARQAMKAISTNQAIVIPGWKNWLVAASSRFVPRSWTRKIVNKLQTIE